MLKTIRKMFEGGRTAGTASETKKNLKERGLRMELCEDRVLLTASPLQADLPSINDTAYTALDFTPETDVLETVVVNMDSANMAAAEQGTPVVQPMAAEPVSVSNAADLQTAISAGNSVTLTDDILLNATTSKITFPEEYNGTINGASHSISGANTYQVFEIPSGAIVTMSDLTITNARHDNESTNSLGGAIENYGTLTLSKMTISNCYSIMSGGAIYNAGTLTATNVTFNDNVCGTYQTSLGSSSYGGYGGAIGNHGTVVLNNCTITGSTETNTDGSIKYKFNGRNGAGIYTETDGAVATLTLNGVTIQNCWSSGEFGGALFTCYSNTSVIFQGTNSIINNITDENVGSGGGIVAYGAVIEITDDAELNVTGNSASYSTEAGGGGILTFGTDIEVAGTLTVSDNSASDGAGMEMESSSTLTIKNGGSVVVSNNSGDTENEEANRGYGGGIYAGSAAITVENGASLIVEGNAVVTDGEDTANGAGLILGGNSTLTVAPGATLAVADNTVQTAGEPDTKQQDNLSVKEGTTVNGDIAVAGTNTIAGTVNGDVQASGNTTISGTVTGVVAADEGGAVTLTDGASVAGIAPNTEVTIPAGTAVQVGDVVVATGTEPATVKIENDSVVVSGEGATETSTDISGNVRIVGGSYVFTELPVTTIGSKEYYNIGGNYYETSVVVEENYATIQEAIAAAEADDVIQLSAGDYNLNGQIVLGTDNLTIIGEGDKSISCTVTGGSAIQFATGSAVKSFTMKNINFTCNGTNTSFLSCNNLFTGTVLVENCSFTNTGSVATSIGVYGVPGDGGELIVKNCKFNGLERGVYGSINQHEVPTTASGYEILVEGNEFLNCEYNFGLVKCQGTGTTTLTGNTFEKDENSKYPDKCNTSYWETDNNSVVISNNVFNNVKLSIYSEETGETFGTALEDNSFLGESLIDFHAIDQKANVTNNYFENDAASYIEGSNITMVNDSGTEIDKDDLDEYTQSIPAVGLEFIVDGVIFRQATTDAAFEVVNDVYTITAGSFVAIGNSETEQAEVSVGTGNKILVNKADNEGIFISSAAVITGFDASEKVTITDGSFAFKDVRTEATPGGLVDVNYNNDGATEASTQILTSTATTITYTATSTEAQVEVATDGDSIKVLSGKITASGTGTIQVTSADIEVVIQSAVYKAPTATAETPVTLTLTDNAITAASAVVTVSVSDETGLISAITAAKDGVVDTIVLAQNVTVTATADTTIPANVTLDTNGFKLTAADGVTVTVSGAITAASIKNMPLVSEGTGKFVFESGDNSKLKLGDTVFVGSEGLVQVNTGTISVSSISNAGAYITIPADSTVTIAGANNSRGSFSLGENMTLDVKGKLNVNVPMVCTGTITGVTESNKITLGDNASLTYPTNDFEELFTNDELTIVQNDDSFTYFPSFLVALNNANGGTVLMTCDIDLEDKYQTLILGGDVTIDGQGSTITGNGTDPIFDVDKNGLEIGFQNITIENGKSTDVGGGIRNFTDSTLALEDVTMTGCSAEMRGGAVYSQGDVTVTGNCSFSGNTSKGGAAIYVDNGAALTIEGTGDGVVFAENNGSAVYVTGPTAVKGATFQENNGISFHIENSGSMNTFENTEFIANKDTAMQIGGGTVSFNGGVLFAGNVGGNAGAIYQAGGKIISGNDVTGFAAQFISNEGFRGGAIFANGSVDLTNMFFARNQATYGGAIFVEFNGSVAAEKPVIISQNYATTYGGGIYNDGSVNVANMTIANNWAGTNYGALYNGGTAEGTDLLTQPNFVVNAAHATGIVYNTKVDNNRLMILPAAAEADDSVYEMYTYSELTVPYGKDGYISDTDIAKTTAANAALALKYLDDYTGADSADKDTTLVNYGEVFISAQYEQYVSPKDYGVEGDDDYNWLRDTAKWEFADDDMGTIVKAKYSEDTVVVAACDFDDSGKVDMVDFVDFAQSFNSTDSSKDFDGNGKVDMGDFVHFAQQFNKQVLDLAQEEALAMKAAAAAELPEAPTAQPVAVVEAAPVAEAAAAALPEAAPVVVDAPKATVREVVNFWDSYDALDDVVDAEIVTPTSEGASLFGDDEVELFETEALEELAIEL